MAKKSYIQAITDGLDIVLNEDPKTLIFGEDVGKMVVYSELHKACKKSMVKIEYLIHH